MSQNIDHSSIKNPNLQENQNQLSSETNQFLSILDLPPHILEKILKYIPKDRKTLSLVCKVFYELICRIYENKLSLQLSVSDFNFKDERLEKLKIFLTPMENCELRRLRNLNLRYIQDVSVDGYEEFWELLEVQGKNLKTLELDTLFKLETLNKILTKTENLEQLELKNIRIDQEDSAELDLCPLKELKSLTFKSCDSFIFRKIRMAEDQLKAFKYNSHYCTEDISEALSHFLQHQSELKVVIFRKAFSGNADVTRNFLENCKLEKLELYEFYTEDEVENILLSQTELKELKVLIPISEKFLLKLVQNLVHLEKFSGDFKNIKSNLFWKVMEIKNLRELELDSGNFDRFLTDPEEKTSNLATKRLKMTISPNFSNLQTLTLSSCKCTNPEILKTLSTSLPSLKSLNFRDIILQLDYQDILTNFTHVEELTFYEQCENFREEPDELDDGKISRNEKLKKLKLRIPLNFEASNFEVMAQSYPNLMDLEIFIHNRGRKCLKNEIEVIFKQFKKIEKIFVSFAYTCELNFDISELINSAPNLKFVYIENVGFSDQKFKENVEILRNKFEEVKIQPEPEYGLKNIYSVTLAKNYSIYCSKLDIIEDYVEVSTHGDEGEEEFRFFL